MGTSGRVAHKFLHLQQYLQDNGFFFFSILPVLKFIQKASQVFCTNSCEICALLKPIGKNMSVFPERKAYCKVCIVKSTQHGIN